jgi:hypothetical protein
MRERKQFSGAIAISPLHIAGATGANVNPLLIV